MTKQLNGIAASSGIAIGKAFILQEPKLCIEERKIDDVLSEIKRFEHALELTKQDLVMIRDSVKMKMDQEKAEIFEAHLLILEDPELVDKVKVTIEKEKINAESAWNTEVQTIIGIFGQINDSYMKERAADIKDVSKRVLLHLSGQQWKSIDWTAEEVILIAEDLSPSETAQLDPGVVKGIVTDIGGRTSHSAIMARTMQIPAVVGTKESTQLVEPGTIVIVDGLEGNVILNPSTEQIKTYETKRCAHQKIQSELTRIIGLPVQTEDGFRVELVANIGSLIEVEAVLQNDAMGIGLFRTEFLFMEREQMPSEEEQFQVYQAVLTKMEQKPVIFRTLDIGGDKHLPYLELPQEMNPFLGFRAIRLCLERKDLFRTQLRALLRASVYGHLKIMFPMIATLDEWHQAKNLLMEVKEELLCEKVPVSHDISVGMMVEIPSTAVMAEQFAKEVDFFSIGTNDLIQYTFAADRMNERVSYLYQPCHPTILRLVKMVIDAAHKEGKWTGMCGEMASDPIAIPLLIGLGLDEFSTNPQTILQTKKIIRALTREEAQHLAEKALSMATSEQVETLVKNSARTPV